MPVTLTNSRVSIDPRESEHYKNAQLYKVQVLPVREILEYVKYD